MQEAPEARIFSHTDGSVAALNAASTSLGSCHFQQLSLAWSSEPQPVGALMRCIALSRICYGDHHWKMTEAHVNLAQRYLQFKGEFTKFRAHYFRTKSSSPFTVKAPNDLMQLSLALLRLKDSERNLIKTQELLEELLQNDQDRWMEIKAPAELFFAQLCQCQKRSEDVILCYQKALSYIERSKGETNLECIPVHKKMAGVAQVLGIHATAIQHLAHFIAMRKSPSSGEAAETAHLVAQAAVASKQSEHKDEYLAEKYFQESINAFKEAEGLESAKCLGAVDDFCQFLIATGPQAPIMLKGSLEAKISLFGYLSLEAAETYWLLGGTELAQGHTHLAYKKLKKCLYLQTLLFGTHNKRTVATQEDIDLSK
uniref:Uncharacterized protein n=1 Tax=Gopherus agassizii TaxID=38772 RepID=A0A452IDJ9_9SAUR